MLSLQRAMLGAAGTLHRQYGPDGAPLTPRQRLNLQRWATDFAALAAAPEPGQTLQAVFEQPELAQRVGSGRTRAQPSAATNASLALLAAALGAAHGVQHGASLAQLSALYHDNHTTFAGPDNIVLGGFARLPQHLAAALGARLQLSTPVIAIRHGDSFAAVETAGGRTHRAQYVICTAPLGVLKAGALLLDPPLPAPSQAALGRLGVGQQEKLWLAFDEVRAHPGRCACCGVGPQPPQRRFKRAHALLRTPCCTTGVLGGGRALRRGRGRGALRAAGAAGAARQQQRLAALHQHGRPLAAAPGAGGGGFR